MLAEPTLSYGDTGGPSNSQGQRDALGEHFLRPSRPESRPWRGVSQDHLNLDVD